MTPDSELLAHFVKTSSEDAFAELVRRHLGLVHAAALRQVAGDEHLARDVVQVVFTDLARKAASLTRRDSLAGWLYTSARHTAANVVRSEVRRRRREDEFMREPDQMAVADSSPAELAGEWNQLAPCLDQVMHDLKEVEREALLLRFFQNQPYAEVGARLGMNENTARMRVERALGKLRTAFARRGVVTTAALSAALSVHAAPASGLLPGAVAGSAIAGAAASASVLLPLMSATTLKTGLVSLLAAGGLAGWLWQQHAQAGWQQENQELLAQLSQIRLENSNLVARINRLSDSAPHPLPSEELLKLRGEVSRQRDQGAQILRLQAANQQLHNQLAETANNAIVVARAAPSAAAMEKIADAKAAVLSMILYQGDHKAAVPTNWEEVAENLKAPKILERLLQGFELVSVGPGVTIGTPSATILVRERNPWQDAEGRWTKVYGFADGHAELHHEADGDFSLYEQQRIAVPPP